MNPPPRLYGLVATAAPVALIFRRGPSNWFHLIKWNLADGTVEPGAWARKKIFPRRCDIDPSGRYLSFYIAGGFQRGYSILAGISRLPWLHPLTDAEDLDSTYHRGYHFVERGQASGPFKDTPIKNLVLESSSGISFANERRRGWTEAPDCPPRSADDAWDQHRMIVLEKKSPLGSALLRMNAYPGNSPGHIEYWTCDYALTGQGQTVVSPARPGPIGRRTDAWRSRATPASSAS